MDILAFDAHARNICNRVKKLHALAKISQFMSIHIRRITIKAFIASTNNYTQQIYPFVSY